MSFQLTAVTKPTTAEMIERIIEDLFEVPVCLVSRRGWGKTSSIKHIIKRLKFHYPAM